MPTETRKHRPMTYKGTGWTRGDLGNVPDRNPHIDCHECGDSYKWQDYWKPRYVEGRDWNPASVHWLCDGCLMAAREDYEEHKRRREHKQLTEFARN